MSRKHLLFEDRMGNAASGMEFALFAVVQRICVTVS